MDATLIISRVSTPRGMKYRWKLEHADGVITEPDEPTCCRGKAITHARQYAFRSKLDIVKVIEDKK